MERDRRGLRGSDSQREIDYRRIPETKPHRSHPNHVFLLDDEVWVTRFDQRDAISLTRPGRRIDIAVQRPHDGHVVDDWIYFSTVDGHVVVANRHTLKVDEIINLNTIDNEQKLVLGWCRGIAVMEKNQVWVGFSRIRTTRFKENLVWAKHGFETRNKTQSYRSLRFGRRKKCLDEINLETYGVDVIFSVHDAEFDTAGGSFLLETCRGSGRHWNWTPDLDMDRIS